MAISACERCGKQTVKLEQCNSCKKKCCVSCIKSAKRYSKAKKMFICKTCWGNMKSRTAFKSATSKPIAQQEGNY